MSSELQQPATTPADESLLPEVEEPGFGFNGYAERINGRFAMIGFVAVLLVELFSGRGFLHWMGVL